MAPTPKLPVYRKVRVLVADDEEQIRVMVADALRHVGLEVTVAASGNEAIRLLSAEQPDLVITDMCMPDGDGLTFWTRFCLVACRSRSRFTLPASMMSQLNAYSSRLTKRRP